MTNDRRIIRDTVANDYKPAWKPDLDRRMAWLDKVEEACKQPPVRLISSHVSDR